MDDHPVPPAREKQPADQEPLVKPIVSFEPTHTAAAQAKNVKKALALSQVRQLGDPILRSVARPVTQFDHILGEEIAHMSLIMTDADGAGLAAPQVGTSHRLFLYQLWDAETETAYPIQTVINPQLIRNSETVGLADEGCLSFPGIYLQVERPDWLEFRYQDAEGAWNEQRLEGFAARVVQHEWDHLDGILILQRVEVQARREAMRLWRMLHDQQRPGPTM